SSQVWGYFRVGLSLSESQTAAPGTARPIIEPVLGQVAVTRRPSSRRTSARKRLYRWIRVPRRSGEGSRIGARSKPAGARGARRYAAVIPELAKRISGTQGRKPDTALSLSKGDGQYRWLRGPPSSPRGCRSGPGSRLYARSRSGRDDNIKVEDAHPARHGEPRQRRS